MGMVRNKPRVGFCFPRIVITPEHVFKLLN
jgi:hypothetical protein